MKISKKVVTMGPYDTKTGHQVFAKLDFAANSVSIVLHEDDDDALFIIGMDTPDSVVFVMADILLNRYIFAQ